MHKKLKLGVIGMSDGNGHPYSWSAIFNGYNPEFMAQCPFSVIPEYLGKQSYPQDFLSDMAEVTHVWTQDPSISEAIAKAAKIPHIANKLEDFIGSVDAVLLARDDAENHHQFASKLLEAGLPIYIDKPLALSTENAERFFQSSKYDAQLFSCSALRYAKEFSHASLAEELGKLKYVSAYVPKSWEKYAVHIIEPVVSMIYGMGYQIDIQEAKARAFGDTRTLSFISDNTTVYNFTTLGNSAMGIFIDIIGEKGSRRLTFKDTFYAFRESLRAFILQCNSQQQAIDRKETRKVIEIIEAGLTSS